MQDYLNRLAERIGIPADGRHRYVLSAHLFDDTMRMLDALAPAVEFDAIVGIPYSSNRPGVAGRWQERFGNRVHIPANLDDLEEVLAREIGRSLALCRARGQRLIVQEVGGFVPALLQERFPGDLDLVKGVVEITKAGVWRAEEMALRLPVLHCADSELKRLEGKRCGETIARCLDGVARGIGLSLAGRQATVFGAGWIGRGVADALRRLDMIPRLADISPLKVAEARLDGFAASTAADRLGQSELVVGATGRCSITRHVLDALPDRAIVASGSSRQIEIDMDAFADLPATRLSDALASYRMPGSGREILLVNQGFPANFIPGSGSVPDEIVEMILAELMVLMAELARTDHAPGIHRITPALEEVCANLWLEMRDENLRPIGGDRP